MATVSVNTAQFSAVCEQLSGLTATRFENVLENEVAGVLETAVKYTKRASAASISKRFNQAVPMGIDAYSPRRARRSGHLFGPNLIYYMDNRYPDELWHRLVARRAQLITRYKGARGLSKKSWLQIADTLGLTLKDVPDYVAGAVAVTGRQYNDTSASKKVSADSVVIAFSNAQPTINAIGGAAILQRAIAGRIAYFERNAGSAVFADIKRIAEAYPGLKIAA